MRESDYQRQLIKKLYRMFPNCYILKNDPSYQQGILDILILNGRDWAMLELKQHAKSRIRPNQEYFVELFDAMSFAAFINPSNEEDVLRGLQQAFQSSRYARAVER